MGPRRVLSLLCLALCAAALVGCGGDTLSLDPVANAASKTAETESARIAFSASVAIPTMGTMTMKGKGLYDGRSKTGWMNMNFAMPASAQAELGSNPSMEMMFDASDGLEMYMRSSMFSQFAGDKWVKIDLEKVADQEGIDLGALMNANQADPNQSLQMLMASSDAKVTGYNRIRGVQTTRYSFRVDLRRLAEKSEGLRESIDKMIALTGVDAYPAEAWIDKDGRVRRLKIAMSMNMPGAGKMTMTMVEDLYDFGARVEVFPPAESDVIDFSKLTG